ncbi:hypothetical protein AVEN_95144-1 [Araneus ventricosus]|uniref:Uncharacterized protein n=1 Tax=Araneus ventricosus TaxID=182803 RepID=A0A4Y2MZE2_ARAVE|nr:hypothetical protein AVEN_95144-1 [Araneus ventricosus]
MGAQASGSPVKRKCRTPWKTGSISNPGHSTLKPSTPFLRAGISVSMPMWQLENRITPPCRSVQILNDRGRYDISNTEAGFLVSHRWATARPLPEEVRTITGGETHSPTITMPTGEAVSCLLIWHQLISVNLRYEFTVWEYHLPTGEAVSCLLIWQQLIFVNLRYEFTVWEYHLVAR